MKADEERLMRECIAWRQVHEQEVSVWRAEFRRQQEEFFMAGAEVAGTGASLLIITTSSPTPTLSRG